MESCAEPSHFFFFLPFLPPFLPVFALAASSSSFGLLTMTCVHSQHSQCCSDTAPLSRARNATWHAHLGEEVVTLLPVSAFHQECVLHWRAAVIVQGICKFRPQVSSDPVPSERMGQGNGVPGRAPALMRARQAEKLPSIAVTPSHCQQSDRSWAPNGAHAGNARNNSGPNSPA